MERGGFQGRGGSHGKEARGRPGHLQKGIDLGTPSPPTCGRMSKSDKILEKVMNGGSDVNIAFDDMCHLLITLGFVTRQHGGSHVIFQDGSHFVNLQNFHGKVKNYQVRQVREILKKR